MSGNEINPIPVENLNTLRKEIYESIRSILGKDKIHIGYESDVKILLESKIYNDKFGIVKWMERNRMNVLQGILYINSIVMLYDGRIAVYFGDGWGDGDARQENIRQEEWVNRTIFEALSSGGMKFRNILSICNEKREKLQSNFPVLVFGDNRINYTKHHKIIHYKIIGQPLDRPHDLIKRVEDIFTGEMKVTLDGFIEYWKQFKIDDINTEHAMTMLLNPLRIATMYNAPNLIYIYDNRNIEEPGGIVFIVETELDENSIKKILHEVQRYVCDYILTPILIAESESLRRDLTEKAGDKPYIFRFFCPKPDEGRMKTYIPLIDDITELEIDGNDSFINYANKVKLNLIEFFSKVRGPSGKAINDYLIFAEEIFITTLKIWDALSITNKKVSEDQGKNSIETIDHYKLFRKEKGEKLLIDVLYAALNFEPALKHIESYREHFIHCFHTFCIGFWLLCLKNNNEYVFINDFAQRDVLLKAWFIAAIFHDIGIPIQKAGEYLESLSKVVIDQENLPLYAKWSILLCNPNFHELFFSSNFYSYARNLLISKEPDRDLSILRLNHKSISLLLSDAKHPIVSSMIIYDNISKFPSIYSDFNELLKHVVMPVLIHHIWDETWQKDEVDGIASEGTATYGWKLNNFNENPIAYLLVLCDAISQLERRFEEVKKDEDNPSIQLYELAKPQAPNDFPLCILLYGETSDTKMNSYLKYFKDPHDFISSGDKNILKLKVLHNPENPTALSGNRGEYEFKST